MKRCSKCLLPDRYPGIIFNEEGVCNYCATYKKRDYLGPERLVEDIRAFLKSKPDRNTKYDCVLGFSGGRDSSYLLHLLSKKLGLKILAVSIDNGFVPPGTMRNVEKLTKMLGVTLLVEKHDFLTSCANHSMAAWLRRPSAAMIGMLCAGCRLGMIVRLKGIAKEQGVPVLITGESPFEGMDYKTNIMKLNTKSGGITSFALGYCREILLNPKWLANVGSLSIQAKEFYHVFYKKGRVGRDMLRVYPFGRYIKWEEEKIVNTIENDLKWERNPDIDSTWRGDCDIALLKLNLYKKMLGFNDKDDGLSCLIRDGQITRDEGLARLEKEGEIKEEIIKEIFRKYSLQFNTNDVGLR